MYGPHITQNRPSLQISPKSYSPQFFSASHVDQRERARCTALYISALVVTTCSGDQSGPAEKFFGITLRLGYQVQHKIA